MKNFTKLFILIALFVFNINLSYASSISNINVLNEENIIFDLSPDVDLTSWEINAEIKVMKDLNVSFVSRDFSDQNKLILTLTEGLQENNTYSIISILWPSWNIDFETWLWLEDKEFTNNEVVLEEQYINRVVVLNPTTIEIYFNNIIEEDEIEFKLFNEKKINSIDVVENSNTLDIDLGDKLEKNSTYILMILSLEDSFGNSIDLDESLYDVLVTEELEELDEETWTWESEENEIIEEEIIEEEVMMNEVEEFIEEENMMEDEETWTWEFEEWTIEEVALNSAETPDTGPETTVLIMLTFLLNTVFIFRKKFTKK